MTGALVAVLLLAQPAVPEGDARLATVRDWLAGMEIDPRVPAEVATYERDGRAATPAYADAVAGRIRSRIVDDVTSALARDFDGEIIDVSTPGPGIATPDGAGFDEDLREAFEESFVRVEVLAFFPTEGQAAREALVAYVSPELRKRASSRIVAIERDGELSCVETRGVGGGLVDPMHSCNRITELHEDGLSSQHSQLVLNRERDGFQRVFFKESVKTFAEVPGGLVFHYVNYSRSAGMNRLSRVVARRKIRGSQEKALREMDAFLAGP